MGFVFDDDGVPWLFGKHFPFRPYGGYTEWRAVSAACCLIKKQLFLTMGGFDEQYINGSEDLDLCLRIGQAGRRHYVANESIVTHYVSSSQDRHAFNAANEQRLLARWQAEIQQSLTPRDRILNAANYVLRFATRPWRYNGQRLWRATLSLVSLGRFSHGTARAGY